MIVCFSRSWSTTRFLRHQDYKSLIFPCKAIRHEFSPCHCYSELVSCAIGPCSSLACPRFFRSICESWQIFLSCVPTIMQLWLDTIFLHSIVECFGFFTSSRHSPLYRFSPCFSTCALFVAAARHYAINSASHVQFPCTRPIIRIVRSHA